MSPRWKAKDAGVAPAPHATAPPRTAIEARKVRPVAGDSTGAEAIEVVARTHKTLI
ncbi:hypothetical protein GCM10023195_68990 [Actinoallomurus liliacearum]|uniref:Uncharacterized protein n=1 Tax=Actinoallomurus liliacearum TaxID=1080073 RepID=A0ABP8TT80_9ACTN